MRKQGVIDQLWLTLDPLSSGECTGKQILDLLTSDEQKETILENFESTCGGNINGKIKKDELTKYFLEISTTIPNDEYFARYIEETFKGVCEQGELKLDKKAIMHKVMLIRQRLITISNN